MVPMCRVELSLLYILQLLVKSTIKEISEELPESKLYLSKLYALVNLH